MSVPSILEHVAADLVFAPIRTRDPSTLICLCGDSFESPTPEDLAFEFAQHRQAVRAERKTNRSSLGPRAVSEGFDFGRRLRC